jgi:SpoVK/Ycf46/Vps4 family AAA+-type ATPase
MKRDRSYDGYSKENDKYYITRRVHNKQDELLAGIYRIDFDMERKQVYLYETELKHDELIDLPNQEYQEILRVMGRFLKVRKGYENLGYLYKRNVLMYGVPGSGKTCLVNRIAEAAVKDNNAVCIFIDRKTAQAGADGVQMLEFVLNWLKDTNPDSLLVLIFEEIDEMISRNEHQLLVFLDGQMQRPNTICLGTTNYIAKIPVRFLRPGRFSQTVEIKLPNLAARKFYLEVKLGKDFPHINEWAKRTDDMSIDDLKEVIQSVYLLEEDFKRVLNRLRKTKGLAEEDDGGGEDPWDEPNDVSDQAEK